MKKKIIIPIAIVSVAVMLILFLPVPTETYYDDDGTTRVYDALTYKIVAWDVPVSDMDENGDGVYSNYKKTSLFWYPENQMSAEDLWEVEQERARSAQVPSIKKLKRKYPEYFDLGDFNWLEVYIWQTQNGEYSCILFNGTNFKKSDEEIAKSAQNSATVEEMRGILTYYGVDREEVRIVPIKKPPINCDIDTEMLDTIEEVFWG